MLLTIHKLASYEAHAGSVYALCADSDPAGFYTAAGDGAVLRWNVHTPEVATKVMDASIQLYSMAYLSDLSWLVTGNMNGGAHWVDLAKRVDFKNSQAHTRGIYRWARVGDSLLLSLGGDGRLGFWDLPSAKLTESLALSSRALRAVAVSADQQRIFIGASDSYIYIVDVATRTVTATIPEAHQPSVFALACSPDGRWLVSGGRDAQLVVYDMLTLEVKHKIPAHLGTVNDIQYSPDGRFLATASRDKTIKIWDAETFALLKVLDVMRYRSHTHSVNALLWLPDALISAGDDRKVFAWRIQVTS